VLPISLIVPNWMRRSPGIPPSGQLLSVAPSALPVEHERRPD
jgi:hypothetical protein